MADLKMGTDGISKSIPYSSYLVDIDKARINVYNPKPSRFQRDTDIPMKISNYNRNATGLDI